MARLKEVVERYMLVERGLREPIIKERFNLSSLKTRSVPCMAKLKNVPTTILHQLFT